jgi:hypothetical protein
MFRDLILVFFDETGDHVGTFETFCNLVYLIEFRSSFLRDIRERNTWSYGAEAYVL